jgi:hypothetical protein
LAADRWGHLAIAAAATGRINFKEANSFDINWLAREQLLLGFVEREILKDVLQTRLTIEAAVASASPFTEDHVNIYETHYGRARESRDTIEKLVIPYIKQDSKDYYKTEMDTMREEYIRKFGDPSSPEAKEAAKRDMEAIKRRKLEAKQRAQISAEKEREMIEHNAKIRATRYRPRGKK